MASFVELLRYQFDQNADKPAIIYHGDILTYAELENRALRVAARLQEQGLEKGERVILYTADKLPFLIIHLGNHSERWCIPAPKFQFYERRNALFSQR